MDSILNMLLGGWCADAIGARLEFMKTRFDEHRVRDAMNFCGQSNTLVGKGQITDDSELEITLLYALLSENNYVAFPRETVAQHYLQWFYSDPFDVDNTIRNALESAHDANTMEENAYTYNQHSETNGALMRSAALAAFYWHLTPEELMHIAIQDAQLTHVSPVVQEVNGLYVVALASLLQCAISRERPDGDAIIKWICNTAREPTTQAWIQEGLNLITLDDYDALYKVDHVKHAFVMVVYFLNNMEIYSYETAIMKTLECGGDTNTNAKIVGSLVGAYYSNCIPRKIMNTVLEFDCGNPFITYPRPLKYSVLYTIRYLRIHKNQFTPECILSEEIECSFD